MTIRSVTRDNRCPICDGDHKCSFTDDGLIFCGRMTGDTATHKCFGTAKKDSQWSMYRPKTTRRERPVTQAKPKATDTTNWQQVAGRHGDRQRLNTNRLALQLGLPLNTFDALPLVGFNAGDVNGPCWTVPMVNGAEKVVGISRRYEDGSKKSMGSNGLFVPTGWRDTPGPVFVVEGASDTAAMTAAGLCCVGRPSDKGGVEMLYALLSTDERPVIIVGERDESEVGNWPGLVAAMDVAAKLAAMFRNKRAVKWSMVPDGAKDARAYLTAFEGWVPWGKRGEVLADHLTATAVFAGDERATLGRAVVQMMDAVTRMNGVLELIEQRGV